MTIFCFFSQVPLPACGPPTSRHYALGPIFPSGSKDPNLMVLGPTYHADYGTQALQPHYLSPWILAFSWKGKAKLNDIERAQLLLAHNRDRGILT